MPEHGIIKEHLETRAGTLPTANANLLSTDITPLKSSGLLRVDFCPSVSGILTVTFTKAGAATSALAYGGAPLTAGALYPLEIMTIAGETVNFQFSSTTGTYRLIVREV
jgi:hypothetical protein